MKDINKIIDSLSPGEQNVMYNALRVKLDKKPEYTISKDEHGYYVSSDKRMFGTFRFEIPVGATVYINYAHREVVSTDIKYLGLLEE